MAKKVLVVDDEKLIVKGIRFSLEQDGMEVDCAYDGEEALSMAKEKEYDMISRSPMKTLLPSQSIRRSFTCTTFAFSSFGSWRAARRMMALMRAFTSRMLNGFVM